MAEATITTRREAESAASSGINTSHTAANELIPPVAAPIMVISTASATDDMICARS